MPPRFTPTLFDKLISGETPAGLADSLEGAERGISATNFSPSALRFYTVPNIERFGEQATQATVRRELAWLLNTTHLGASIDLGPYPKVAASVLNYGVPDLAGRTMSDQAVEERARDIRAAIETFEPRLDKSKLNVRVRAAGERENAVTYLIEGVVHGAASDAEVRLLTDVEADTGAVTVRD
jgi:type VI secretion system protein ImpF